MNLNSVCWGKQLKPLKSWTHPLKNYCFVWGRVAPDDDVSVVIDDKTGKSPRIKCWNVLNLDERTADPFVDEGFSAIKVTHCQEFPVTNSEEVGVAGTISSYILKLYKLSTHPLVYYRVYGSGWPIITVGHHQIMFLVDGEVFRVKGCERGESLVKNERVPTQAINRWLGLHAGIVVIRTGEHNEQLPAHLECCDGQGSRGWDWLKLLEVTKKAWKIRLNKVDTLNVATYVCVSVCHLLYEP